jgi:hypothetical protein
MRRLHSHDEDFITSLVDEARVLLGRGYPPEMIIPGFAKAILKPRTEAIQKSLGQPQLSHSQVRCITTYDSNYRTSFFVKMANRSIAALQKVPLLARMLPFNLTHVTRNKKNIQRLVIRHGDRGDI